MKERMQWLKALDRRIIDRKDEILATVAAERGCSEHNVLISEYTPVRLLIREYLRTAKKVLADEDRSRPRSLNFGNKRVIVQKLPLGTVGIISPSNFPFSLPLGPIISALLTQNLVKWKPSPETPKTNTLVNDLIRHDDFLMLDSSQATGEALVQDQSVDKIHFTGSVSAGSIVAEENAAVRPVPPTLELGGSNAAIVLGDADLEEAAQTIAWARFSGLNCNSIKRVFVARSCVHLLVQQITRIVWGLNSDERMTKFSDREIKNYNRFLKDLVARGHLKSCELATSSADVKPIVVLMNGYDTNALVLREETFCPILPIIPIKDLAEAVVNETDNPFGLGTSIFTRSSKSFWIASAFFRSGGVYHNDALTEFAQPQVPFGGNGDSGWGYTHGREGLLDFVRLKTIIEERKTFRVFIAKKLGLYKLQLYPWTYSKQRRMRKWIDTIIKLS